MQIHKEEDIGKLCVFYNFEEDEYSPFGVLTGFTGEIAIQDNRAFHEHYRVLTVEDLHNKHKTPEWKGQRP